MTGVDPRRQAPFHLIRRAALRGHICPVPRRGDAPAFTLLDSWLPTAPDLSTDKAAAELARLYPAAHAPASVDDFVSWSGLPRSTARRAWTAQEGLVRIEVVGAPG